LSITLLVRAVGAGFSSTSLAVDLSSVSAAFTVVVVRGSGVEATEFTTWNVRWSTVVAV
jgi:hypothetical protein